MPLWLLSQIPIHSWNSRRTNLKFCRLCLHFVWLFVKQYKSNLQCMDYLSMCNRRDLSFQHLSLHVCESPAMIMHCSYHQQFPFGPIWKTSWVIQGWIFLLSISNAAFWQEKMSKVTWKRKVQLRDVSIISWISWQNAKSKIQAILIFFIFIPS